MKITLVLMMVVPRLLADCIDDVGTCDGKDVVVIDDIFDPTTMGGLHADILAADGRVEVPEALATKLRRLFPETTTSTPTPTMIPCTVNVGPQTNHHDTTKGHEENDVTVLMWANDDPESHLRFFDDNGGEVANVEVKKGRAVVFDNHRFKHQLDGPDTSRRALLGPMTFNSVLGDFIGVGGPGSEPCKTACAFHGCCGVFPLVRKLRTRRLEAKTCEDYQCLYKDEDMEYVPSNCKDYCDFHTPAPTFATPSPTMTFAPDRSF